MARLADRLVGHRESLQPLLEAQAKGRLASTLMFSGPSGIGKRLAALVLAQALVCERRNEDAPEACGECGSCLRLEKEQSESLMTVFPEGAAIKIEQARDVLQFLALRKLGRARIILIDQAHLMNPQAANALLKSLEEPPAGTYFILITPLAAAVLPTIRSRSQLVRFRPLSPEELRRILGPEADDWLVESAQGSVENANRLLESREEFLELEEAVRQFLAQSVRGFPAEQISKLRDLMKDKGAQAFVSGLVQSVIRDALRIQAGLHPLQASRWAGESRIAAAMPAGLLAEFAEMSLAFEQDLSRNVDRGLLLENLSLRWRSAVQSGGAPAGARAKDDHGLD
jgi:DNA polymerase III subunit delta'